MLRMIEKNLCETTESLYSRPEGYDLLHIKASEDINKRPFAPQFKKAKRDLNIKVGGLFRLVIQYHDFKFIIPDSLQEQYAGKQTP